MSLALELEKIERIKEMRAAGHTFQEIGQAVGVAHSTAHIHGKNYSPEQKRNTSSTCQSIGEFGLVCKRHAGHRGVHLSDETGKLIYWEN